jgi:uncharacterized protein (DUF1330 family)
MNPAGRVRIRNIMLIARDYSDAPQSFLFAQLTRAEHDSSPERWCSASDEWEDIMKTRYTVALSMLAGVAVGAAAVQGLHAQAKPPVYTVTEIDVKNVDAYLKEYTPVVQPIIKKHGGTLLAASLKVTALEGTAPKRVAINRWESLEAAQALYNSAEFKAAQQIGNKYATFRRYAVEGLAQ